MWFKTGTGCGLFRWTFGLQKRREKISVHTYFKNIQNSYLFHPAQLPLSRWTAKGIPLTQPKSYDDQRKVAYMRLILSPCKSVHLSICCMSPTRAPPHGFSHGLIRRVVLIFVSTIQFLSKLQNNNKQGSPQGGAVAPGPCARCTKYFVHNVTLSAKKVKHVS